MQSLSGAKRDDDKERKYWQKWLSAFIGFTGDEEGFWEHWDTFWRGNLESSFNPMTYIPWDLFLLLFLQSSDTIRL